MATFSNMAPRKRAPQSLAAYRKKRDFEKTSEPAAEEVLEGKPDDALIFVVHKHDATRMHYDLRLEINGALPSWAIPKGPSYDPADKRLAIETEDHPLAYAEFEGRIPDDEYGGGDSLLWDRGTWDTVPPGKGAEQKKRGRMHIRLEGEKLKGEWHLVRTRMAGKKQQWLCMKAHDGTEREGYDVIAERPESVKSGRRVTRGPVHLSAVNKRPKLSSRELLQKVWPPMLAQLAKGPPADESAYVYEIKYDGFRGLAAISGTEVTFHSRNDLDLSTRFPAVAKALRTLRVKDAVLDGEVVVLDEKGRSSFQQLAGGAGEHRYVVFDLLWLDGQDLRKRPIEERRELLESVLAEAKSPIALSERIEGSLSDALEDVRARGLEGLIAKKRESRYEGKRTRDWLKLKVQASQEVAIVGFTPIKSGGTDIGALLVGVKEGEDFVYAGKVGTGFSNKLREELYRRLQKDRLDKPIVRGAPRVKSAVWVEPKLVAEVEFTEWTGDGKLRHPAFKGLRIDKSPDDVVRERPGEETGSRRAKPKLAAKTRRAKTPTKKAAAFDPEALMERVKLTHPDRIVYPDAGYTKADVFAYIAEVSPLLVRALDGRPLALQQWPQGIKAPGFFRQNVHPSPDFVTTVKVQHDAKRTAHHVIIDKPETALWLANHSALTLHMWSSHLPNLDQPDWVIFDLDPGAGTWDDLIVLADALHGFLDELGLESFPKTSGKRGIHVLVPIRRGPSHEEATAFAVQITTALARAMPKLATVERMKAKRGGRLYLDALQNGEGKTIVAPYTLRDTPEATVSMPLEWSEVTRKLDPGKFTLKTARKRLDKVGDLFERVLETDQELPKLG